MKQTSVIVRSFFKQLSRYPIKLYYSQPHTIQSSVGIIFKFPGFDQIQTKQEFNLKILAENSILQNAELLFVQRADYHLDKNAYNIVFPGGQCDQSQSDLQACQRELKEEIGIKASEQCIHLGQLPKNFYYLKKRGKKVHISCHAYCLKSSSNQWEPKLNSDQLRKFKWVKLSDLILQQNYKLRSENKLGILDRIPAFAGKIVKENLTNVTMVELDLGMDRNLWGLTLHIWSYMLQMALINAEFLLSRDQLNLLKGVVRQMGTLKLEFKPYTFYKIPVSLAASCWYYLYRIKPFTYNRNQFTNSLIRLVPLLLVLLMMALSFSSDFF